MRQLLAATVMSLFFLAAVATPTQAGDETVLEANVPDGVKAGVVKKYAGSIAGRWFIERAGDKIVIYETKAVVTTKDAAGAEMKREVALRLSPEGKIIEEQEAIPVDTVPETVKKGFDGSRFGKGTIKKVTRLVTDEKVDRATYTFEVLLAEWEGEKGDFRFDVTFDSTGTALEN